jgi:tetratricopeptide (TPR) repeat protein/energy-coupling factor transporter ATP-binding protein EcfA2
MPIEDMLLGRDEELAAFRQALDDPSGKVVLVMGHQGMGKTQLLNHMAKAVDAQPDCASLYYVITDDQSNDTIFAKILTDIENAASARASFLDFRGRGNKVLTLANSMLGIGNLIAALIKRPGMDTRDKLMKALDLLSERLSAGARFVIFLDPYSYPSPLSAGSLGLLARSLPQRIMLVCAQRPEDTLCTDSKFRALPSLVMIPKRALGALAPSAVREFIDCMAPRIKLDRSGIERALVRYHGHPYAIAGALRLLIDNPSVNDLPLDSTQEQVGAAQWKAICTKGADAVALFRTYAVLHVPVPKTLVLETGEITNAEYDALITGDAYLHSLLLDNGDGRYIYHSILMDHILHITEDALQKSLHARAVLAYRKRLNPDGFPDALAAVRLSEHVKHSEGAAAFILCFINECTPVLIRIGKLDDIIQLSNEGLSLSTSMEEEATITGNMGIVYKTRSELDKALEMYEKALAIYKELGNSEGMAANYTNMGSVYNTRGELDKALEMYEKALAIYKELGNSEGMAAAYGNIGIVYKTRGELGNALEMYKKALAIHEELGRKEGMASDYTNMGVVYNTCGELDKALEMHEKALAINEELGRKEGMASNYTNMGIVYNTRGELDKALEMHEKALAINEELGRKEGMANAYGNMGVVHEQLGEMDNACLCWRKSLELFAYIGAADKIAKIQALLNEHCPDAP